MGIVRRSIAFAGVMAILSFGLATTPAGLFGAALASGGGGCDGGGGTGPTPGPTQVFASHFSGLSAAASYTIFSGTTETDIAVDAFQGQAALAVSGPTSINDVFLTISVSDGGVPIFDAFGCASNPDFQINQTLTSATLGLTSIQVTDLASNTSTMATVSAAWAGTGDITRVTQTSAFHSGAFTNTMTFVSFDRFGVASGTVADQDLGISVDGPADFAELDKVNSGGVFVCVQGSC